MTCNINFPRLGRPISFCFLFNPLAFFLRFHKIEIKVDRHWLCYNREFSHNFLLHFSPLFSSINFLHLRAALMTLIAIVEEWSIVVSKSVGGENEMSKKKESNKLSGVDRKRNIVEEVELLSFYCLSFSYKKSPRIGKSFRDFSFWSFSSLDSTWIWSICTVQKISTAIKRK